ncbi:MAG: response regulator [Bacteroides sp.]|nr:response regulator [Bacteroides sp.]
MKKVLVVDDKASIFKVLSVYLKNECELTYCEDPIKAIDWLYDGNEPDLIISDIRMPKMTGDEFLLYLKGNELWSNIPVIMLSSEESSTERQQMLEAGADDYILKPFNPTELKARVKRLL